MHTCRFRRLPGFSACIPLLALVLAACGDDDQKAAEDDVIDLPGDVATLEEALAAAAEGGRIQIHADTLDIMMPIVIRDLPGITLLGREGESGPRPVLRASLPGRSVLEVEVSAPRTTIRGIEIIGSFLSGVRVRADEVSLFDCRIEDGSYSVYCSDGAIGGRIEGNLLLRPRRFGVFCADGAMPLIANNTIFESLDCGIYTDAAGPRCERNLIVASVNWGVACFDEPEPVLSCNGIFGGQGPYQGCTAGPDDRRDDPQFCDPVTFALPPESPYLMGVCGVVGAVGACE